MKFAQLVVGPAGSGKVGRGQIRKFEHVATDTAHLRSRPQPLGTASRRRCRRRLLLPRLCANCSFRASNHECCCLFH